MNAHPQYIVTICRTDSQSYRAKGSWACFIGDDKQDLIHRALQTAREWTKSGCGPYKLLAGTLNETIVPREEYSVEPYPSTIKRCPWLTDGSRTWLEQ